MVSILVFVELALDGSWDANHGVLQHVSILVFVELALDDIDANDELVHVAPFQSLFSWNLLLMMVHGIPRVA